MRETTPMAVAYMYNVGAPSTPASLSTCSSRLLRLHTKHCASVMLYTENCVTLCPPREPLSQPSSSPPPPLAGCHQVMWAPS